jgi:hypothetical protein
MGQRVEGATWRKSSYSGSSGGNCVEVGTTAHVVIVRDTADRSAAMLAISPTAWRDFTDALK